MPPPGAEGDMPPPGAEGDMPPPGAEGDMPPPGAEGDMPPPGADGDMPPSESGDDFGDALNGALGTQDGDPGGDFTEGDAGMDTAINEGAQSGSPDEHIQEEPAEGGFGDDGMGDMDEPDADDVGDGMGDT